MSLLKRLFSRYRIVEANGCYFATVHTAFGWKAISRDMELKEIAEFVYTQQYCALQGARDIMSRYRTIMILPKPAIRVVEYL